MLTKLHIRNYAIIEKVTIDFSKNLTIITGETGAGKSILLGALHLIMGGRADTKVLHDTEQKCVVEAHFAIKDYNLKPFFEQHELDYDDELVISREITPSGKSRAFINDTPTQLPILKQLTAALIDLHQQFDTLDIHNVSFQLRMIDALAGNKSLLVAYDNDYKSYQANRRKLAELEAMSKSGAKEMDFLLFQLNELHEADLQKGEQESLETELKTLSNAEEIKRILTASYDALAESEQAITGGVRAVSLQLSAVTDFQKDLPALYERLQTALYELDDIATELNDIADDTEYDPERIEEVNDRLSVLFKLQKKHQATGVEELIALRDDLQGRVGGFGDLSGEIERIKQTIDKQYTQLAAQATELSARRNGVIADFEERVHTMLRPLSMPFAQLKVQLETTSELTAIGSDKISFLFSANKGGRLETLKDVASGGEISRLTLVTKSLVASSIPLPTMIFDEIDAGVSGDVAGKMGNILNHLAKSQQVIAITHSPQVSARADAHYFVYKHHGDDRTTTNVKQLSHQERIMEIAKMLSSDPPSKAAIENATSLLQVS
jgi:DNA repair protein RecN (Recombination protein N)